MIYYWFNRQELLRKQMKSMIIKEVNENQMSTIRRIKKL